MSFGFGKPVGKALLRVQTVAQMPLATQATTIATLGQQTRQIGKFADGAIGLRAHLGIRILAPGCWTPTPPDVGTLMSSLRARSSDVDPQDVADVGPQDVDRQM